VPTPAVVPVHTVQEGAEQQEAPVAILSIIVAVLPVTHIAKMRISIKIRILVALAAITIHMVKILAISLRHQNLPPLQHQKLQILVLHQHAILPYILHIVIQPVSMSE
jgi:hypothetical protein